MEVGVLRGVAVKVSQYFRDFLESDFKRQQAPRRSIVLQTDAGFKAGMRLRPYPGLDTEFWKLLSRPTGESLELKLTPRRYTRPLSATLARVIDEQILAIPEARLTEVQIAVLTKVSKTLPQAATDPEGWIDGVRDELADAVCERIVRPLIGQLEGPTHIRSWTPFTRPRRRWSQRLPQTSMPSCRQPWLSILLDQMVVTFGRRLLTS